MSLAGVMLPSLSLLLAYGPDYFDSDPAETPLFWSALLIGLAGFYAGFALIHRGRRMCAKPALEVLAVDAPLFLRSFSDDDLLDPTPRMVPFGDLLRRRYEESIAVPLGTIGPMVSIGRPGSTLAELGGARLFVPDHAWQEAVKYLRQRAAAVAIIVGRSEGLWWEISTSLQEVPLVRLLLVFPYVEDPVRRRSFLRRYFYFDPTRIPFTTAAYKRMEAERQARYKLFRDRVQPLLPAQLPETIGTSQFLDFTAEGHAGALPRRRPWWHAAMLLTPSSARTVFDVRRTLQPFVTKLAASR
jgi:hypothetical protein